MTQKKTFLEGESDAWFRRNRTNKHAPPDLVIEALVTMQLAPEELLEIGASDGRRLRHIRDRFGTKVNGIEPSMEAVNAARSRYGVEVLQGTADSLPFDDGSFDCVVMGFCLYLCDRQDLFQIAKEADRVLSDKGVLVIYDFSVDVPVRRVYHHLPGIWSYKMDYRRMFLWNPAYREIYTRMHQHGLTGPVTEVGSDDRIVVSLLEKDLRHAYLER